MPFGVEVEPSDKFWLADLIIASATFEASIGWYFFRTGIILVIVAVIREILGSGKLMGYEVLGNAAEKTGLYAYVYSNNGFMLLAPMALIIVGVIIWVQRAFNKNLIEK